MLKIRELISKHKVAIIGFIVIIVLVIQLAMLWREYTKENITQMSQEQVETTEGVKKAADNAHIKLDYGQQKQISETIKEIRVTEKEPVYIIQTKGSDAEKRSE